MLNLIAQLKAKYHRHNQTSSYWILELKHSTLTKQLLKVKPPKTTTFFLFNQKTRWASRLQINQDYYWVYRVNNQHYYQIQDWKLLGEPKLVNRCYRFLKTMSKKTYINQLPYGKSCHPGELLEEFLQN